MQKYKYFFILQHFLQKKIYIDFAFIRMIFRFPAESATFSSSLRQKTIHDYIDVSMMSSPDMVISPSPLFVCPESHESVTPSMYPPKMSVSSSIR